MKYSEYQPRSDLLKDKIILITGAGDGIGRAAAISDPQPARRAAYPGAECRGGAGGGADECPRAVAAVWPPSDSRSWRRRALFAGANVLLIRAYRSHADEGHAVRRGDVGICLIDNRHGVDSG